MSDKRGKHNSRHCVFINKRIGRIIFVLRLSWTWSLRISRVCSLSSSCARLMNRIKKKQGPSQRCWLDSFFATKTVLLIVVWMNRKCRSSSLPRGTPIRIRYCENASRQIMFTVPFNSISSGTNRQCILRRCVWRFCHPRNFFDSHFMHEAINYCRTSFPVSSKHQSISLNIHLMVKQSGWRLPGKESLFRNYPSCKKK